MRIAEAGAYRMLPYEKEGGRTVGDAGPYKEIRVLFHAGGAGRRGAVPYRGDCVLCIAEAGAGRRGRRPLPGRFAYCSTQEGAGRRGAVPYEGSERWGAR